MKIIKQISTNKIVYREDPHTPKSIDNASSFTGIAESDLEVADEPYTVDQWNVALKDQKSWAEKRAETYAPIQDQLDMLYWDKVNSTTTFKDHRAAVKAAHQKPPGV